MIPTTIYSCLCCVVRTVRISFLHVRYYTIKLLILQARSAFKRGNKVFAFIPKLKHLGFPAHFSNPRCVMTLAACAEMKPGFQWKSASENYHGTHDIIQFINTEYPNKAGLDTKGYQENSRETFRDETLKLWVNAGIMEAKYGLASNSKDNSYRFTSQFAALLRRYGTPEWNEHLEVFLQNHRRYESLLKQVKDLDPGYPVNYNGLEFTLDRSPHNKIGKEAHCVSGGRNCLPE